MNVRSRAKILLTLSLVIGIAAGVQAAAIVEWDATGDTTIRSQSGISDTLFSTSTALGSDTTFGDIYGGYITDTAATGVGVNKWQIGNTDFASEVLRMKLQNTTGAQFAALALTPGSPTLNAGDTFSVGAAAGSGAPFDFRWLISNNSKFYVSDIAGQTLNKSNATPTSVEGTLTGLDWYEVDLSNPGGGEVSIPGTATTDNVFDTVDGVGFFAQDVDNFGMRFATFEVTAIPEPSTSALLVGALGIGWALRRRRSSAGVGI